MKGRACFLLALAALVIVCSLAAADDTVPTVAITSPTPGITVASDAVAVAASYTAPEGSTVQRVQLAVDGSVVTEIALDPPQASGEVFFTWMARQYAEGDHQITVSAFDSEGRSVQTTIAVLLRRARPALGGARITSPKPGDIVSATTPVQVEFDQAALVQYVIFLVDDVFKAMSNVPPFTYLWDTTRYLNGLHNLQVKAYLSNGGQAFSSIVGVEVDNPSGATSLQERGPAPAPAVPEPPEPLARTAQPALPPPMRTDDPSRQAPVIAAADTEIAAPGTAPFVSPSGELIQPPPAAAHEANGRVSPIQIAALPGVPVEQTPSLSPAGATAVPPPPAERIAVEQSLPAPAPVAARPATPVQPGPAPTRIVSLPTPAPRAHLPLPPPQTVAGPEAAPAPIVAAAPTDLEQPVRSRTEIAMLPPRPAERGPTPKVVPEPTPLQVTYIVQSGDCLWSIADQHGVSPTSLAHANKLSDPGRIYPGQQLRVPVAAAVYFGGRPLATDVAPVIKEGRTVVSFRSVIEEAGGQVTWDPATRQARAVAARHNISVTIGSAEASVDGKAVAMDRAAALRSNRTVVPLRFLGDALDLVLQYQDGIVHIAGAP